MFVSRIHHCHAPGGPPCVTLHIQPMLMHTFTLLFMGTYTLMHLRLMNTFTWRGHRHVPCITFWWIRCFPTLLLMCTYMLVHLHVAFSFFYWFRCTKKKKKKRGVHQPDYLHGLGACLSHRPFQTLRGAPLASCRLRWMHTTALGTGQSQSFW